MKMMNNKKGIKFWILILFLSGMSLCKVNAQSNDDKSGDNSASVGVIPSVSRKSIPWYVKTKDKSADTAHVRHYYKEADFIKYPHREYKVIKERVKHLEEGDIIPDELWDLPLRIANDPMGRDSTTLRELAGDKLFVIDIWGTYCKPCFESMHEWEAIVPDYARQIQVVGLMLDYDFKIDKVIRERGWKLPQIIGPEAYLLSYFFMEQVFTGPSVWIKNNELLGCTKTRSDNRRLVDSFVKGEINKIPASDKFIGVISK